MSSGERPIGAAKGKQSGTEALCQPPPPPSALSDPPPPPRRSKETDPGAHGGGGEGVGKWAPKSAPPLNPIFSRPAAALADLLGTMGQGAQGTYTENSREHQAALGTLVQGVTPPPGSILFIATLFIASPLSHTVAV